MFSSFLKLMDGDHHMENSFPIQDRPVTLLSVLIFQGEGGVLQTVLQGEVL